MNHFQDVISQAASIRNEREGSYERYREERLKALQKATSDMDKVLRKKYRTNDYPQVQVDTQDYVQAKDLAKTCQVSSRRIIELCYKGSIIATKINHKWYIPKYTARRVAEAYEVKRLTNSTKIKMGDPQ